MTGQKRPGTGLVVILVVVGIVLVLGLGVGGYLGFQALTASDDNPTGQAAVEGSGEIFSPPSKPYSVEIPEGMVKTGTLSGKARNGAFDEVGEEAARGYSSEYAGHPDVWGKGARVDQRTRSSTARTRSRSTPGSRQAAILSLRRSSGSTSSIRRRGRPFSSLATGTPRTQLTSNPHARRWCPRSRSRTDHLVGQPVLTAGCWWCGGRRSWGRSFVSDRGDGRAWRRNRPGAGRSRPRRRSCSRTRRWCTGRGRRHNGGRR